jgi:hypothetical protein
VNLPNLGRLFGRLQPARWRAFDGLTLPLKSCRRRVMISAAKKATASIATRSVVIL